jgi:predicted TIM-barrel fold metal-dependent hydrolase
MTRAREDLQTGQSYIVVSADTHASPETLEEFLAFVDPAHREAVREVGELSSAAISMFGATQADEDVADDDPVRATATRRLAGMAVDTDAAAPWLGRYGTDWVVAGDGGGRRQQVLEDQGIHAEVVYPGPVLAGSQSAALFSGAHRSEGIDLVWPAIRAYDRWLADFCAASPGRRAGCLPVDLHDMDAAVDEIESARDRGLFGGVMLPAMSTTNGLRGYSDDYYEPFWSACEDHGMVINIHTGASGVPTDARQLYDAKRGGFLGLYEVFFFTRRPLWFLIFGGVFDRHPNLQVVISENGVQWLPAIVRDMEQFFDTHGYAPLRASLKMRPAEYVDRHLHLGGSLMGRDDAERRDEIGVDRLMWGADYPHLEGAVPVHRETLRHVFGGMPEADLRRILGLNAVDLWGFDQPLLQSVADRVGPTVADLASPLSLDDFPETFAWSLGRPVPLAGAAS